MPENALTSDAADHGRALLAPGIVGMSILFTSIFAGMEMIWDRQFGFLKETLVAPVSRISIMIGRTLGGATVATLQGMIVFVISMIVGFRPVSIPLAFVGFIIMLLIAILFTALGTAIASKLDDFQGFQLIMNFLIMPLFFLSGALFPLQGIPKVLSYVIAVDPLSYGVDGLRAALIGTGHYGLIPDIIILGSITAVLLAIGTYFFSKIQI